MVNYNGYTLNRPLDPPLPEDAVPPGTFPFCGLVARHTRSGECVRDLRDLVATLQLQKKASGGRPKARAAAS